MNSLLQDLRYGVRLLWQNPVFTVVTLATLALGIGATTAIFSVVNAVLLRPLPYAEPDRLVRVYSLTEGERWTASPPDFVDWQESDAFDAIGAFNMNAFALTGDGPAEQVQGAAARAAFFSVLGVSPMLGRTFVEADETAGQDQAVVLGHGLWTRRFGGDAEIVGSDVTLDGRNRIVVGVMPAGFEFPRGVELWTPLAFTTDDLTTQRGAHYLTVVARLGDGRSVDQADAAMRALADNLAAEYPETNEGWTATVVPLGESIVGDLSSVLWVLAGAVGVVLLIACTNVASLQLVRSFGRERELAVRAALGASRRRLVQALLCESLVIGLIGGATGVLLAQWLIEVLTFLAPTGIPRLEETRIDGTVLAFTVGLSILAGGLSGVVPAVQASLPTGLAERLKETGGILSSDPARRRSKAALVVLEVALAVVLVTATGLLLKSFVRLQQVDPGFDPSGVLTFNVSLPDARYPEPPASREFFAELLNRVEQLPGVRGAAAIFGLPLSGFGYQISVESVDGRSRRTSDAERSVQVRVVTPGYFRQMAMPIVQGRGFEERDGPEAPQVVVVSESTARLLWPGTDPLGHTFSVGTRLGLGGERVGGEVVGIVSDVKDRGLAADTSPTIYAVHAQFPESFMSVTVRTDVAPVSLVGPIRAEMADLDAELPMFRVRAMTDFVDDAVAEPRFVMLLVAWFGLSAIALAAIGTYGVMAHAVGQRRREFGIRLALGARAQDIVSIVLRHGVALAALGVVGGLAGALMTTRLLQGLLFGVAPNDPATFAAVAALLLAIGVAASYLPARRATRVDPLVALRDE
ncbi:MAG: ABC transporter permease [Dehalococcoidia bacterium]|jgi:predicted permease|nr:ABC transporter permease [Dehalococcoidia bacterium]